MLRGLRGPFLDSGYYYAQADWLARNASLIVPENAGARYFHGMPLLVSVIGRLTGEFAWTGSSLNLLAGFGAALLFYRNFPRRGWGICHALLLPAWVSTTAVLQSEAGMWAFALLALTALRMETIDRTRRLLLVVGGYALACRPTAVFILGPMLVVAWLLPPRPSWRTCCLDGLAVGVFPSILAIWTWLDTGHVFPQSQWQAQTFAAWNIIYGGGFPPTVFTWPGHSFIVGLFHPTLRPLLKLLNLGHAALWLWGLVLSVRAARKAPCDTLALLCTLELAVNGLFVLTMGGAFGFTMFYRYLATQANAFLVLAWLRYSNLKAGFWWAAVCSSLFLASAMARRQ